MRFNLPNQLLTDEMSEIITRELRKQKITLKRLSEQNLKELAEVNKWIRKTALPPYLVRKKLDKDLGHGIFLRADAKPILKGAVIGAYAGEVSIVPQFRCDDAAYAFGPLDAMLLTKEEQAKFDKGVPFHPRRYYSMKVDALKKGNFTRFINHSSKPNIAAHLLRIPSNTQGIPPSPLEVFYIAKKRINPGEQLLICYEDEEESYWGVFKIVPFPMTPTTFQVTKSLHLKTENED